MEGSIGKGYASFEVFAQHLNRALHSAVHVRYIQLLCGSAAPLKAAIAYAEVNCTLLCTHSIGGLA